MGGVAAASLLMGAQESAAMAPPLIANPIAHNFQCGTVEDPIVLRANELNTLRFWAEFPRGGVRLDTIETEPVSPEIAQVHVTAFRDGDEDQFADGQQQQLGIQMDITQMANDVDTFTMSYAMNVWVGGGGLLGGRFGWRGPGRIGLIGVGLDCVRSRGLRLAWF